MRGLASFRGLVTLSAGRLSLAAAYFFNLAGFDSLNAFIDVQLFHVHIALLNRLLDIVSVDLYVDADFIVYDVDVVLPDGLSIYGEAGWDRVGANIGMNSLNNRNADNLYLIVNVYANLVKIAADTSFEDLQIECD